MNSKTVTPAILSHSTVHPRTASRLSAHRIRLCGMHSADTAAATELIIKHPEIFRDYEITKGKMDDVFLAVTGKALEGGEGR